MKGEGESEVGGMVGRGGVVGGRGGVVGGREGGELNQC